MKPIKYIPESKDYNLRLVTEQPSAWGDIAAILPGLIKKFNIETKSAIEFGVEYGYSTSALANLFESVVGIDTFTGDIHAGFKGDIFEETKSYLSTYPNVELVKSMYQDYIKDNDEQYDFAHVDIIHTYEDTFTCGEWCINHADIVVFHDTVSFVDVFLACEDLAKKYNMDFYNYEESHGLGILINKK